MIHPGVLDVFTVYFFCGDEEVLTSRHVLTIFDVLALVGGMANFIIFLTGFTSNFYSKQLLEYSLIRKLYKVQNTHAQPSVD